MKGWGGLNRRNFPRAIYPCLIIIRQARAGLDEALLTHTENIGMGGVCVILKKSIKLFTLVEIELDLLDTISNIKCEGKIVWSVQRKEMEEKKSSFFDTGIEFMNITARDQQRLEDVMERVLKINPQAQI